MTQVSFSNLVPPAKGRMKLTLELSAEVNVSQPVATQKANRFLVLQVGDQLFAGNPEILVGERLAWRMPVHFAPSKTGPLGVVGYILVDTESGEVSLADGLTPERLLSAAESLYGDSSSTSRA